MNPFRYLFPKLESVTEISSLTTTAQAVVAAGSSKAFAYVTIAGGAADEIVIFRAVDNTPEYFRVAVPAGSTVVHPGFETDPDEGLEVVTASAAGDVTVAFFQWE